VNADVAAALIAYALPAVMFVVVAVAVRYRPWRRKG
jgi:hypothetical protein